MKINVIAIIALLLFPSVVHAATPSFTGNEILDGILSTLVYSAIGIVMAAISFKVIDLLTPGDLSKDIAENHNLPLAVLAGLTSLGICIIIAAAIAG